jgi:rubrerythrin
MQLLTCQECPVNVILVREGNTHVGSEVAMRCPACGARYVKSPGGWWYADHTRTGDHYG